MDFAKCWNPVGRKGAAPGAWQSLGIERRWACRFPHDHGCQVPRGVTPEGKCALDRNESRRLCTPEESLLPSVGRSTLAASFVPGLPLPRVSALSLSDPASSQEPKCGNRGNSRRVTACVFVTTVPTLRFWTRPTLRVWLRDSTLRPRPSTASRVWNHKTDLKLLDQASQGGLEGRGARGECQVRGRSRRCWTSPDEAPQM